MAGEPLDVFISYSHKDETLKNELLPHLKMLQREGRIKTWQDRDIEAGTEWATAIKEQLEKAKIILLMVTTNFLASDYCYETEMQRAVQRHKERTARVIPIVLKPCGWKYSEFKVLQVLPKDGKPISRWQDPADAWFDVEEGIRKVIDRLHEEQRQREEEAEELIAIEQQQQDLEAEQREWEQKQQVEIERLRHERGELAKSQAEWARQEQARQQLEAEQREWERQRQAETDRLQRDRAELERLKAEWQQREQERRQQVTEIKTSEPKGISTKSAGLPKLQTIQFQTPTLRSEPGGLFGLGKKWTTNNQSKQATQFSEDLSNGVVLDMVKIPSGQFWMGSPDGEGYDSERPQHSVEVSEFWMGKYAVTQAQWTQVAAYPKVEIDLEPFPAYFKGDNRPVEQVNWDQAVEFCQRLSRRTDRTYRALSGVRGAVV